MACLGTEFEGPALHGGEGSWSCGSHGQEEKDGCRKRKMDASAQLSLPTLFSPRPRPME